MDRIGIPRMAVELKFKGERPMGQTRTRQLSQVLAEGRGADRKSKRKDCGKKDATFCSWTCIKQKI
jgi:hypothetical protein